MYTTEHVRRVLDAAGIEAAGFGSGYITVFCPFHGNDRTPAGEVMLPSGTFYCFNCKMTATLEDYVSRAAHIEYFMAVRLIRKYLSETSIVDEVGRLMEPEPEYSAVPALLIEELHQNALDSDRAKAYYSSRHITLESINRFSLGYSPKMDMITLPFTNPNGEMYIGFDARSIEGKRFLAEGPKTKTLFNIQNRRWSPYIYVTESILDAIRLEQVGAPAVARMGTGSGKVQVGLLTKFFSVIYVIQDNDSSQNNFAGQTSARKLLDKLGKRGIIIEPPKEFKDIGDMTDEQIRELVASNEDILKGI